MFKKKSTPQFTLRLKCKYGQYFIEGIPIEILSDNKEVGYRILTIKSINSKNVHYFKVNQRDKLKSLKTNNTLRGIVLRKY